jgi:GH18 family chitinase
VTVVSYDDTWSLAEKARFAKKSGMGGCFTWSLDQVGFGWEIIHFLGLFFIGISGRRYGAARCRSQEFRQELTNPVMAEKVFVST